MSNLEQYLDKGLYGIPKALQAERLKFLSAHVDDIVLALSDEEVKKGFHEPLRTLVKEYPDAHLYLDGQLDYAYLSPYVKFANEVKIAFTIFNDVQSETEIGLVLTKKNK